MKLTTIEGTEIVLSPVELAELVELGLAEVDIDLTDVCDVESDEEDSSVDEFLLNLEEQSEAEYVGCICDMCLACPQEDESIFTEGEKLSVTEVIEKLQQFSNPDEYFMFVGDEHLNLNVFPDYEYESAANRVVFTKG